MHAGSLCLVTLYLWSWSTDQELERDVNLAKDFQKKLHIYMLYDWSKGCPKKIWPSVYWSCDGSIGTYPDRHPRDVLFSREWFPRYSLWSIVSDLFDSFSFGKIHFWSVFFPMDISYIESENEQLLILLLLLFFVK
jgi:hypothetical protein